MPSHKRIKLAKHWRIRVSWLRASDSQVLTTGWTKFTGDRRVKVIPADRSHTWGLGIRNVTPSDTGFYLCQVNTEPKITLRFHLSVTKSFAFIPGNNERYVQTGSQLELKCRISKTVLPGENPPIIEWTRNGTLEPRMGNHVRSSPAVFNKAQNSVESTLRIDSVTLDDSGIYKCTSNAASEATVTVLVTSGEQRAAIVEENSGRSGHSNLNKYLVVVCGLLPALLLHMRSSQLIPTEVMNQELRMRRKKTDRANEHHSLLIQVPRDEEEEKKKEEEEEEEQK
ncbi:hypothetical protein TCAL_14676 [Tigriopus californicus]|uniref:Ig-like domain-containing protein n=1 Tax=Tigriopus californicus TaxID=6832 RepID=A0A553NPI8_TIGCA|nr:hypothetical protein TCAL_14676 [Tigriopus californicus]